MTKSPAEVIRAVIWGKTYPELSRRYQETVCTGAVREDGRPIRLYPVPLRYLQGDQQYRLYDVIEVEATKSVQDTRPESYKINAATLRLVGHVDTDSQLWAARREAIFRDATWHFESIDALRARQAESGCSIGLVTPREIVDVRLKAKPPGAKADHERKWEELTAQQDLFPREYKRLAFIPFEVRVKWRCTGECSCAEKPHDMMVLDWGLLELGRRDGEAKALERLRELTDLGRYDLRFFMGNFFLHQATFGIIGLWYPKRADQIPLL